MPTCSYCKKGYKDPRGLTIFTFDGRAVYYCSAKCRRNQNLGRDARKLNWIRRRKGFLEGSKVVSKESLVKAEKIEKTAEK